eukprot:213907_1
MSISQPPQPIQTEQAIESLQTELKQYQQQIEPLLRQLSDQWVDTLSTHITHTETDDYPTDYYTGRDLLCRLWTHQENFGTSDIIDEKIHVLSQTLRSADVIRALGEVDMIYFKIETANMEICDIQKENIYRKLQKENIYRPALPPPPQSKPKRKIKEIVHGCTQKRKRRKRQRLKAPISKNDVNNNAMQSNGRFEMALNSAPHNIKRAAPTIHETTNNLRPDLLLSLNKGVKEFNGILFGTSNNKIPADDSDCDDIESIHSETDIDDQAILDRKIWQTINAKSKNAISSKSTKWNDKEDDKLCAAVAVALKNKKTYGKPGSSTWWIKVTKKVNNRPYQSNKKRLKDGSKDKKAYRHSEMSKFTTIIRNRRSASAVTSNLKQMNRYTKMVTQRKHIADKKKDDKKKKEQDDNDWRADRKELTQLIKQKLTSSEQEQNNDKNDEKKEEKGYDIVIREIKNKCDDLEDIGGNLFTVNDLDLIRDATFGDTKKDIKEEYMRLKARYKNDGKTIFTKLIKEARRMLQK